MLELGCGWGSISLWVAEHFPGSNVLAVSNSQSQREYIWWGRWRIFFMACAELFGFDDGEQWRVGHYLFERPA